MKIGLFMAYCVIAFCDALIIQPCMLKQRSTATPRRACIMGRRFENNKLRMAKTALAYAKKASYIGKKVIHAVKAAGDDPVTNRALAAVQREAQLLDVPKEVVERNVKKAKDPVTADYKELTYEVYGYGGAGLIINCLSDNNNRATADVSAVVTKAGCKLASQGSVAFSFKRQGRLAVNVDLTEEAVLEHALEAGCDGQVTLEQPDPDGRDDSQDVRCVVITEATELGSLQSVLIKVGIPCSGVFINVPMVPVECSVEDEEANYKVIDRLEDLDDVISVEHSMA